LTARNTLSANHYDALWLHYGEDLAVAEIATIMGKTRVHVKVMLHRARHRLRQALRDSRVRI